MTSAETGIPGQSSHGSARRSRFRSSTVPKRARLSRTACNVAAALRAISDRRHSTRRRWITSTSAAWSSGGNCSTTSSTRYKGDVSIDPIPLTSIPKTSPRCTLERLNMSASSACYSLSSVQSVLSVVPETCQILYLCLSASICVLIQLKFPLRSLSYTLRLICGWGPKLRSWSTRRISGSKWAAKARRTYLRYMPLTADRG